MKMEGEEEGGVGEEKEYKEHLSLEIAAAAISDEKIIDLCKFVI